MRRVGIDAVPVTHPVTVAFTLCYRLPAATPRCGAGMCGRTAPSERETTGTDGLGWPHLALVELADPDVALTASQREIEALPVRLEGVAPRLPFRVVERHEQT